jgi:predicted component of type VI protein secretion system
VNTLVLRVLRGPDAVPGETRQVTGRAFSIGRGPDNDWVLADPDRHLSKRHCVLGWRDGAWQLADVSTNGTFVNREREAVGPRRPRPLRDGDRLQLGAYEIEVRILEPVAQPAAPPRPAPAASVPDQLRAAPPNAVPPPAAAPVMRPQQPAGHPAGAGVFASPVPPAHPRSAQAPGTPPAADQSLLVSFLRGAGIASMRLGNPTATFEELGRAFRALVAELRATLFARAAVKGEFRIEQTMVHSSGNNPLKFSPGDDEALAALLGAGHRGDMGAAAAITDALRDVRLHELATMAAMQSAVRALLGEFDPDALRREAEQGGMALVAAQRKARAWDAFERLYARISEGLADDFDSVFGQAFARAYQQALDEVRAQAGQKS